MWRTDFVHTSEQGPDMLFPAHAVVHPSGSIRWSRSLAPCGHRALLCRIRAALSDPNAKPVGKRLHPQTLCFFQTRAGHFLVPFPQATTRMHLLPLSHPARCLPGDGTRDLLQGLIASWWLSTERERLRGREKERKAEREKERKREREKQRARMRDKERIRLNDATD